jgi:putative addiction module component (TIGR02574 family)
MKISAADTLDLPISERIQLVTEIWDGIAEYPEKIEITAQTKALLAKRLANHRVNPDHGSPWDEVKTRISPT